MTTEQKADQFVHELRLKTINETMPTPMQIARIAYLAGYDAGSVRANEFSVYGTDGCKNCETGRITLYFKKGGCAECLENKVQK